MIDLRSDTVTRPTKSMRQAMARAEVGDDVFSEDPTVNHFQEVVAERFGYETALFVPSGVMGNQIAIKVHTQPGDEVVLESESHIFNYEMATMASFSGVLARPIPTPRGHFTIEQLEQALRPHVYYLSRTGLVCLENTHNMKGGTLFPLPLMRQLVQFAHAQGLPVHLDGARIFNASMATGKSVRSLASGVDSLMFCLSKGLGAPVGSMLIGSRAFIEGARRVRKQLGGGMRQVGVLAAAGLYALEHHVERLAEDHENARWLAERLAELSDIEVTPPETNIIVAKLTGLDASELAQRLQSHGVLIAPVGSRQIRLVTHLDVTRADMEAAMRATRRALRERRRFD